VLRLIGKSRIAAQERKQRRMAPHHRVDVDNGGSMERLTNYAPLSGALARLTDEELAALVAEAPLLHAGVGGRSVLVTIDSTPIFVKRIALTDLERRAAWCSRRCYTPVMPITNSS
jgi:hypothetical protein